MKLAATTAAALAIAASTLGWATPNDASVAVSHPASAEARLTVSVEGVSCASCTLSIRRALKKLDGVKNVLAGSEPNEAVVAYDPDKINPEQIVQTIDTLGFKTRSAVKV